MLNKDRRASTNKTRNPQIENRSVRSTTELEAAFDQLKKSKEHLKKALALQKTLFDTTGAMIIVTDEEGVITLFNHEASLKLGYTPDEIIHKETPVLFHSKADIQRKQKEVSAVFGITVKNGFQALVEKARRNIHEEEQSNFVTKDGKTFPVSLTVTSLRDAEGSVIGFVGVAIDISERMKAEKELLKTRRLFLQLLDNYPDGSISIIDKDFRFVYTGGELHKELQMEISQLIGKDMYPMFPESLRKMIRVILEDVFEQKKYITDFELPFPIRDKPYIMDAFPLMEEDGSVNNIGVIIKNISKLKNAEDDLRESLEKERSLGELKSRFVSMASHEFRTPLSTVLSSAYLIEKYKSTEDQPKREIHLQRITSSVNMLTDVLNEFLNIGKIEEGKIQAKSSEFNFQEVVQSTVDEMKMNLRKQQEIVYQHEGNANVFLDKSLLKHIVLNLVSNASKFSPDNSIITIKTSNHNKKIVLSVKDQGMGISIEDQKHLMERFFRGGNATNIQGTGLGLYIVSKYAEMMNGTIQCKSRIEKGTEFIVTFNT